MSQALTPAQLPKSLPPEMLEQVKAEAKSNLYFFAKGVLGYNWLNNKIHLPLCRLLEAESNTRLSVTLPRGWLKTTLVTISYPVWRAIRNPNIRILLAQNTSTNAVAKLSAIRSIFESNELFRLLFPELLPDDNCTWTSNSLQIKRSMSYPEGTFEAVGIRSQVISRHYDIVIEDDTVAPDLSDIRQDNLCPTKEDIEQAIGWHRLVTPLLVDIRTSQSVVVGTRWFEKDLLSFIRDNEPDYHNYIRACRETNGVPDENGEPTYPDRFDADVLRQVKNSMGPYLFSCLYMNKPLRSDDMVFNLEWITYYQTHPPKLICYTSVDPAGDPETAKGNPDNSVVLTCGKDLISGAVYVLEYTAGRFTPGEQIAQIFEHVKKYRPVKVGIESVAYQRSMLYWIRESMRARKVHFLCEPINDNKRSKNARILGLQPSVASGMLRFRASQHELISEMLAFPLGSNDDILDALAMQLDMWTVTRSVAEQRNAGPHYDPLSLEHTMAEMRNSSKHKPGVLNDLLDFSADFPDARLVV